MPSLTSLHHGITVSTVRTTVNLDDDILAAVETLARASGKTLGQVLSELARRSLQASPPETSKAIPRFQISADTPKISLEAIRRAWAEGD
jgi:hypothetical protein